MAVINVKNGRLTGSTYIEGAVTIKLSSGKEVQLDELIKRLEALEIVYMEKVLLGKEDQDG